MGWTYTDLARNRLTLEQAKQNHVDRYTYFNDRPGATRKTEMLAHEWHRHTFYAIARVTFLPGHEKAGQSETYLCVDLIDTSGGQFGYKDMTEECGPYVDEKPSAAFAAKVYQYIPHAKGYAVEFRQRMGIPFKDEKQLELI